MTAREQAEELRQQAIKTLLTEKQAIEQQLKLLGYGQENGIMMKRRGRPPKAVTEADPRESQQTDRQAEGEQASRTI
jgi:hypothetical protein